MSLIAKLMIKRLMPVIALAPTIEMIERLFNVTEQTKINPNNTNWGMAGRLNTNGRIVPDIELKFILGKKRTIDSNTGEFFLLLLLSRERETKECDNPWRAHFFDRDILALTSISSGRRRKGFLPLHCLDIISQSVWQLLSWTMTMM